MPHTVVIVDEPASEGPGPDRRSERHRRRRRASRSVRVVGAATLVLVVVAGVVTWQAVGRSTSVAVGPRTWTQATEVECADDGSHLFVVPTDEAGAGTTPSPERALVHLGTEPVYTVEVRNTGSRTVRLSVPAQDDGTIAAWEPELAPVVGLFDGRPVATTTRVTVPAGRSAVLRVAPPAPSEDAALAATDHVELRATSLGVTRKIGVDLPTRLVAMPADAMPDASADDGRLAVGPDASGPNPCTFREG
jgi:hypothetical protein